MPTASQYLRASPHPILIDGKMRARYMLGIEADHPLVGFLRDFGLSNPEAFADR